MSNVIDYVNENIHSMNLEGYIIKSKLFRSFIGGSVISNHTLNEWCRNDGLARFLVDESPKRVFADWFELIDNNTKKPYDKINWKKELNSIHFFRAFLKCFQYSLRYGLGVMNFNGKDKFQILGGDQIFEVIDDDYDDPLSIKVNLKNKGSKELDMKYVYWMRIESESSTKGMSYLHPIRDDLALLKCMKYSMGEASAREGSKFLTVGIENCTKPEFDEIMNSLVGISARKVWAHLTSLVKRENIQVHSTQLSNVIPLHIQELLKSVSAYCGYPALYLNGINNNSVYTGSEVNIGNLLEAYKFLQDMANIALRPMLHRLLDIDMDEVSIKWINKQRLTEKEEIELEVLQIDRDMKKLQLERLQKNMNNNVNNENEIEDNNENEEVIEYVDLHKK